ncbi:MAG: hypothetical protein ABIR18_12725 [Chitinophagaceae bacterium]
METDFTQQEILLNTKSSFLAKDWCLKNDTDKPDTRTEKEKLEEACWNGLFKEMIPELFKDTVDAKDLTLWKVREMGSFLELELSTYPAAVDKYESINPSLFLTVQEYN